MSPSLLLFFETKQVSNHKACMEQRIPFMYSANPYIKILNVSLGKSLTLCIKCIQCIKEAKFHKRGYPKGFVQKTLWRWLPLRTLKRQSLPTVLLRTHFTRTIKFHPSSWFLITATEHLWHGKTISRERVTEWLWEFVSQTKTTPLQISRNLFL